MVRQTSEIKSKNRPPTFFSQLSIALQTGSTRFQPNIAKNYSAMDQALPETQTGREYDSPVA